MSVGYRIFWARDVKADLLNPQTNGKSMENLWEIWDKP